jgi:KipI family sensor histidine kinase inhibitor
VRIGPLGDAAIVVELGRTIDPAINARVHAIDRALREAALAGVVETVPTYRSLVVHYDHWAVRYGELATELRRVVDAVPVDVVEEAAGWAAKEPGAPIEIPVAYGGEEGPDLGDVARHAGLSEDEVARRHAAGEYRVAMLGFAPGFAYLLGMDPTIAMGRLDTPRVRVPAGSLGIADGQTGIYPYGMPGGWRLIGRTALPLFDPQRDPPAVLRPGMGVRFDRASVIDLSTSTAANDADQSAALARSDPPAPSQERGRAIHVVEPGILATVQDGGRRRYERFGVPPSGAADGPALDAGNLAVGNDRNAAAIEITAGGAEFEFTTSTIFALSGADMELTLDGRGVASHTAVHAQAGERLRVGLPREGFRAYLCLDGGIGVPKLLGSRATYLPGGFGGHEGRALRSGDVLPLGPATADDDVRTAGPATQPRSAAGAARIGRHIELPFVPGGQWDDFPEQARRAFANRSWRVSHQSDRMGLRLEGAPLEIGTAGVGFVSDGTVTGAIQVSADGLPIVLFVDRQTTGGYPKLGAVASVAFPLIAQAQAGDEFVFRSVSIEEVAEALRGPRAG